jgi:cell division protease FtsH
MTYGRFLEYLEMGWIKQVDFYDNDHVAIVQTYTPELGNKQLVKVEIPIVASQLIPKLKDYNIDFDAHSFPKKGLFLILLDNVIIPILYIIIFVILFLSIEEPNDSESSIMSRMNAGKSPARFSKYPKTGVNFNDIAGIDEAKLEFEEIVSFLKEPERYTRVGAKIPKGVMLVGPPGTGKTLLAKAIANEAKVPFFNVAGSEFVEMYIGIGAARIRDLFSKASENAPCIVFIDEIDAVGRERSGGGNDEREQTLNQLLTEMDGFKENKNVIVVGATNRVDILDAALLRPGRFDRQITVGLPDRLGRIAILEVHAKDKMLADDVSLEKLADRTPGFSGADLANLLNEAGILATRYKKRIISNTEINEAADRIIGGITGTTIEDTRNKRLIAYQETSRALVASILKEHDEVDKITIKPRGGQKGFTWFIPDEENQTLISRDQLLARISVTIAGRLAEKIIFGSPEITTGTSNDLQRITAIARSMVTKYGMSRLGPIAYEDSENSPKPTKRTANKIDAEVCRIINHCEKIAKKIILDNRVIADIVVEKLLEVETLDGKEFRNIINQYTILPTKVL